ncbi:pyruvate ferredoxin oxidoreductase, partial [bacterium]|nr:pyruvate ferredoxin oxidoreductase [bacterium]
MNTKKTTNIVFAGLGGQGVLKASDIFGEVVFNAGFDVKKAEIHGMSQRGGSVTSDVRYGEKVFSPMIPAGEADYLVILNDTQIENNKHLLKKGGVMIVPDNIPLDRLKNTKSLNVALLGLLSKYIKLDEKTWLAAIYANLPEKLHAVNK